MVNFVALPLLLYTLIWLFQFTGPICCQKPSVVNIGAVFTFNSVIGRAAKPAMEAAISDINADPNILNGIKLNFLMEDSNCSGFLGSVEGISLFFLVLFLHFSSCFAAAAEATLFFLHLFKLPSIILSPVYYSTYL